MQPIATSAVKDFSRQTWEVELPCPQCGAPVVLEETDRMLSCAYCRVRLYLNPQGHPRYFLAPRGTRSENVLFAPYWRFKGLVFVMEEKGVTQRLVDSNLLALHSRSFPFSLGVRPQVLRLRFVASGIGGKFLRPDSTFQGHFTDRQNIPRFQGVTTGTRASPCKAFIGEMVSLIYSPFLARDGTLFDAILEGPPTPLNPGEPLEDLPLEPDLERQTEFIPMLCPACGWDLEGDKNALVLLCRNCDTAWQALGGSFKNVDIGFIPKSDEAPFYLPFWRIQAGISETNLNSCGDLVRLANLPKAVRGRWEEQPLAFWIPAFKVQPQLFLRLAQMFSVSQPSREPRKTIPHSPLHTVSLPLSEAVESIKVLITSLAFNRGLILARLATTEVTPDEYSLVYCPFSLRGSELIHPEMQVSISANALKWGNLL
jgi:predicted RNA-binding Zn-ribbon protein involved in translation (DUF1610 family)